MKKIALMGVLLLYGVQLHATHRYGTNADNITSGTLDPTRLNSSSVTLQGNQFNGANQLLKADSSGNLGISNLNGGTNATAGTFWRGDGIWSSIASSDSVILGLVITTASSNLDRYVITADCVIFGGNYFTNISTVILTSRNGPGGFDTGSAANLTWYSMFFITNGSTVSVIASSGNAIAPTMPSGYTNSRKIGYFYINGSGNIVAYYKNGLNGDVVPWDYSAPLLNVGTTVSAETPLDLTTNIPPKTERCKFHLRFSANDIRIDARVYLRVPGEKGNAGDGQHAYGIVVESSAGYLVVQQETVKNMLTDRSINYQTSGTVSDGFKLWLKSYSEGGL